MIEDPAFTDQFVNMRTEEISLGVGIKRHALVRGGKPFFCCRGQPGVAQAYDFE